MPRSFLVKSSKFHQSKTRDFKNKVLYESWEQQPDLSSGNSQVSSNSFHINRSKTIRERVNAGEAGYESKNTSRRFQQNQQRKQDLHESVNESREVIIASPIPSSSHPKSSVKGKFIASSSESQTLCIFPSSHQS